MKAFFNHRTIEIESIALDIWDRAFLYGDGLFETILAKNGEVKLLNYHWKRILEGARILKYILPVDMTPEYISGKIKDLTSINNLSDEVRIKLMIWRKSGGKYEPENNNVNFLLSCEPYITYSEKSIKKCEFCESISNTLTPLSSLKTISALPYILGSIEKKEKSLDDLIILDTEGNISEMLYSNIFWIKENIFYTPDLSTGCVSGVMRTYLIEKLRNNNVKVIEERKKKSDILAADHIFASNALGLIPVTGIENKSFGIYRDLYKLNP